MTDKEKSKNNQNSELTSRIRNKCPVNNSSDATIHSAERICAYCGTEVAVGDYCCHKCGVEYEQE